MNDSASPELSGDTDGVTPDMIEQAATWHVRVHAEDATPLDQAQYAQWQNECPEHAAAAARVAAIWARFEGLSDSPARAALESVVPISARKKSSKQGGGPTTPVIVILAGVLIAGAAWFGLQHRGRAKQFSSAHFQTPIGHTDTVTLEDQSRIILNTSSTVDIQFTRNERRITLRAGEVLVDVAKDPTRSFVVMTPEGSARALGTRFSVRRDGISTLVTVLESRVEACAAQPARSSGTRACIRLGAGEQSRIRTDGVEPLTRVDARTLVAWTQGNLVVNNWPLSQVLTELGRYRQGGIQYDTAKVGGLRVSGVFPIGDTDRALETLAAGLPIRVTHPASHTTLITHR